MRPGRIVSILALAASGTILLVALSAVPLERVPAWGWDASVFRAASRSLLAGDNPYDPASITRHSGGAQLATIPYFVYAPIFAVGFIPFAVLPPAWTLRLWFLANLAMVVTSVALTLRGSSGAVGIRSLLVGVGAAAVFPPVRTLLILGQSSAVLLLALAASAYLIRRGRGFLGGFVLGITFFKPHLVSTPIFLGLRRLGRPLLGFGVGLAALALPTFAWLDDWWIALWRTRAVNLSYGCLPFASAQALLTCLLPSTGSGPWLAAILLGVLVAVAVILSLRKSTLASATFELQMSLAVVAGLLVLDNIRVADLVLLLFPLTLLIREYGRLPRRARQLVLGLILVAFVFPYAAQAWAKEAALGALPVWYSVTSLAIFAAVSLSIPGSSRRSAVVQAEP